MFATSSSLSSTPVSPMEPQPSPRKVDQHPIRTVWHSAVHWILEAFRTTPTIPLLLEAGLPPHPPPLQHARFRYTLRIVCAQPTANPAAAALPPSFPTAIPWRDPFTGRHAVPYPTTMEWDSTRTWVRPLFHIDNSFAPETMVRTQIPDTRPSRTPSPAQPPLSANQSRLQPRLGLRPPPI